VRSTDHETVKYFSPSSSFLGPSIIISRGHLVCVIYLMYEIDHIEGSYTATAKLQFCVFQVCYLTFVLKGWIIFKLECIVYEKQK
jgi:hypothetical protein